MNEIDQLHYYTFLEQEIEDLHADDDLMREVFNLGYETAVHEAVCLIKHAESNLNHTVREHNVMPRAMAIEMPRPLELHCTDEIDIGQRDSVEMFCIPPIYQDERYVGDNS